MTEQHTPGQWEAGHYKGVPTVFDGRGNGTIALATVHNLTVGDAEANSHIMAAAPELLSACEAYLDAMERYGHPDKTDRLMRKAIAKAKSTP